jgi:hypothetical protein
VGVPGEEHKLPSWLPDFTRRVVPDRLEFKPQDHLESRRNEPKLVILNHALHAEGFELDTVVGHVHLGKGIRLHNCLWLFDQFINCNQTCLNYSMTGEEQHDPFLNAFLNVCEMNVPEETFSSIAHPRGSVLEWTLDLQVASELPLNVVESLPCWDILWRKTFGNSDDDAVGELLEGVFSPRMVDIFRETLGADFIGASVIYSELLEVVLDRLASASPWSEATYWSSWSDPASYEEMSRARSRPRNVYGVDITKEARIRTREVQAFLASIDDALNGWGTMRPYTGLCCAILLDCDNLEAFKRKVTKLKKVAKDLNDISNDYRTRAEVRELAANDERVAARSDNRRTIEAHFEDRVIFWTKKGFHGLSSPGVTGCGQVVVLLDGLSYPMVVKNVDNHSGRQQLVGCAIIRGVDMRRRDTGEVKLPVGFSLGEKKSFKVM